MTKFYRIIMLLRFCSRGTSTRQGQSFERMAWKGFVARGGGSSLIPCRRGGREEPHLVEGFGTEKLLGRGLHVGSI